MDYRSEIDGLRALAVVPVVLFHAGVEGLSGGFTGVDIFFVISGFLITSLILNDGRRGQFSLRQFYERRARRILPALLLVIFVCVPFAYAWMMPDEIKSFGASVLGALLSGSNFVFYYQSGYFDQAGELKPLLHTWSLGVEEQFYILFPLLMIWLARTGRRPLCVLLAIFTASLLLAQFGGNFEARQSLQGTQWLWWATPSYGFFLLPARAWELLMGAVLAIVMFERPGVFANKTWLTRELASMCGLGMMLASFVMLDQSTPFPSVYTLLPTAGAALVIAFATPGTTVYRMLSSRPFVAVGLISYSLYLWHHPLFAFARIASPNAPGVSVFLLLALVAIGFAALTWWFVERPFRDRTRISTARLIGTCTAVSAALVGFFIAGRMTQGFEYRFPISQFMAGGEDVKNSTCRRNKKEAWDSACVYGDGVPSVAIVGDSHAASLVMPLAAALSKKGLSLYDLHVAGCLPVRNFLRAGTLDRCRRQDDAFDFLMRRPEIKTVVVMARWATKFQGSRFNNLEGGVEFGSETVLYPDVERIGRAISIEEAILTAVQEMVDAGKRVVVVYPVPEVGWDVPRYMSKLAQRGALNEDISTSYAVFQKRNARVYAALDALSSKDGLQRVYPEQFFCNTVLEGRCMASLAMKALYNDTNHLSWLGASFVADAIAKSVDGAADVSSGN